jgi:hypothetical protein
MTKAIAFIIGLLIVVSGLFSQSPKNQLYLKNIKEYRDNLVKQNSIDDTLKYQRCNEKVNEFLLLKRQYLIKLDVLCAKIKRLNEKNDGTYYSLLMGESLEFDWGDCNRKVEENDSLSSKYTFIDCSHCIGRDNVIDRTLSIEKTAKFKLDLSGMTNGAIYYRED